MFSLEDFKHHASRVDFQRSNLFSVIFSSTPGSNAPGSSSFGIQVDTSGASLSTPFGDVGVSLNGGLIGGASSIGGNYIAGIAGGAALGGAVETIVGTLSPGSTGITGTKASAGLDLKFAGLMAYSVQLPEIRINTEIDRFHNAPGTKILARDLDPLVISFRMDSGGLSYRTMVDWNYMVEDPETGLRAFPQDVSADIQIILYDRNQKPKTVYSFNEVIPVSVSAPELSYESENQIATFNVTFAYRRMKAVDALTHQVNGIIDNVQSVTEMIGNVI